MKRILSMTLAFIVLAAAVSVPAKAQAAQDVLNKMIEAMGGRKNMEKVNDMTMTGTIELVQYGASGTYTTYQKEPNKMRQDMELMGMNISQACDGEKVRFTNPQTQAVEEMTGDAAKEFARQSMGNEATLLNPAKYGITYTLKPKETVDGIDCIVLEQKTAEGHASLIYVDSSTYYIYKARTKALNQAGAEIEAESVMSDYKKVGDFMLPHSIKAFQDGAEFARITFTQISFNTGLADSLFALK